jgi:arginyl-tRNA--protein-N-Asp/Glu arginylyltransferase
MRIFREEFGHEYDSYSFGYTVQGEREPGDVLTDVYADGFLPYTPADSDRDLFYMSRGVRVPISSYSPSSENRRIFRKFDDMFETSIIEREALRTDTNFSKLLLTYFEGRHGSKVMPPERLAHILTRDLPMRAIAYSTHGRPVAYVLEVTEKSFVHYWYSCYELEYAGSSLGMWLMLDAIRRAETDQRTHVYLGTAYGEKARYKTNVPGLEFWDGNRWNADARTLESLMRADETR